jgi:hypothetical protein
MLAGWISRRMFDSIAFYGILLQWGEKLKKWANSILRSWSYSGPQNLWVWNDGKVLNADVFLNVTDADWFYDCDRHTFWSEKPVKDQTLPRAIRFPWTMATSGNTDMTEWIGRVRYFSEKGEQRYLVKNRTDYATINSRVVLEYETKRTPDIPTPSALISVYSLIHNVYISKNGRMTVENRLGDSYNFENKLEYGNDFENWRLSF